MTQITVDETLEEAWSLTDDWIDDIKAKTWRSSCRIGTTIQMKNDQKRVDEAGELLKELDELSMVFFTESGMLERQRAKFEVSK